MLATLAGCHTAPLLPNGAQTPAPATSGNDASYDWHGLLVAPLGSPLKEVPISLHEVLVFRDVGHGTAGVDDAECYGADAPPRFLGRMPAKYLLCFKQDRLSRIQASVSLTSAQASDVFAAACAGWLKQAAESASGQSSECEGRDGDIRFSAQMSEGELISITLDSAPVR